MGSHLPQKVGQSIAGFTGRGWLLPHIQQWLDATEERVFLVTGKPGSGKSMVSAWLGGDGPAPADAGHAAHLAHIRSAVKAVHFCQATSGNSPKAFAESVARQLARRVDGFAARVATSLSDRQVHISSTVNVGQAANTTVTGVELTLELGSLTDEPSFDRALREPLKALYEDGRKEPIVIVVDALDESLTYSGAPNVPQLLRRLGDLPTPVRIIATTRPDPRVLDSFRGAARLDVVKDEPSDQNAIRAYSVARLATLPDAARTALATRIAAAADGQFLYAFLLLNQIADSVAAAADPDAIALPDGLTGYYSEYLVRELEVDRTRWHQSIRPILGLLAVAQGDGLTRDQIARISRVDPDIAIEVLAQYLESSGKDGPFRPFHRSLVDFLIDERHVNAADRHAAIAAYYDSVRNGASRYKKWDGYGVLYTPTHLAGSLAGDDVDGVRQLVQLVLDPAYRAEHRRRAEDLTAMQLDLLRAVRAASGCDDDGAISLVMRAALAVGTFRREELRPEQLFAAVRSGAADEAVRGIDLFELSPKWRAAVQFALAWSTADRSPQVAARLRDGIQLRDEDRTLRLLQERVDAALGRRPMPPLRPLPPPASEDVLELVVERIGGSASGDMTELMYQYADAAPPSELQDSTEYLARMDGPILVSFALANPTSGEHFLKRYLGVHTGYQYVQYRQTSLWVLLGAVLRHPDQEWVRQHLEELAVSALAGTSAEFQEALPTAILALSALEDQPGRIPGVGSRFTSAIDEAEALGAGRAADSWAFHKRRLAAIVQTATVLPPLHSLRSRALTAARMLPYGFGGFHSPACLNLAEAIRTFAPLTDVDITDSLEHALTAAHNIRDESFCLRQTARVNAMRHRWWTPDGFDVRAAVDRLVSDPGAPEFSTVHIVGEKYRRSEGAALRPEVISADTPAAIAALHHQPVEEIVRANDHRWRPTDRLDTGQLVNIPDPGFATQLTARFASEVAAQSGWDRSEKVNAIRRLVPLASASPTVLDTVLARLLLVAQPTGAALQELDQIAGAFPEPPPATVTTRLPA